MKSPKSENDGFPWLLSVGFSFCNGFLPFVQFFNLKNQKMMWKKLQIIVGSSLQFFACSLHANM
jgi:hypothetical protein